LREWQGVEALRFGLLSLDRRRVALHVDDPSIVYPFVPSGWHAVSRSRAQPRSLVDLFSIGSLFGFVRFRGQALLTFFDGRFHESSETLID
jgi:hypothetical protein